MRVLNAKLRDRPLDWPLSLVYLDLDDFKLVNDRYGHNIGDAVLIETIERIHKVLRPGDLVGRLGGDEFVVLFDRTGKSSADDLVMRLEKIFKDPFRLHGITVNVTASAGCSVWPQHGRNPAKLLEHADQHMYRSKRRASFAASSELGSIASA